MENVIIHVKNSYSGLFPPNLQATHATSTLPLVICLPFLSQTLKLACLRFLNICFIVRVKRKPNSVKRNQTLDSWVKVNCSKLISQFHIK